VTIGGHDRRVGPRTPSSVPAAAGIRDAIRPDAHGPVARIRRCRHRTLAPNESVGESRKRERSSARATDPVRAASLSAGWDVRIDVASDMGWQPVPTAPAVAVSVPLPALASSQTWATWIEAVPIGTVTTPPFFANRSRVALDEPQCNTSASRPATNEHSVPSQPTGRSTAVAALRHPNESRQHSRR
jgi:hypothetical protein